MPTYHPGRPARAARGRAGLRPQQEANMSTTGLVLLGVLAGIVLWAISVYNGLVAMRQRVNQAGSDIDVQLKQRHDLVPNLVETVKGYPRHGGGARLEL